MKNLERLKLIPTNIDCEHCGGSGEYWEGEGDKSVMFTCTPCKGTGKQSLYRAVMEKCGDCEGTGRPPFELDVVWRSWSWNGRKQTYDNARLECYNHYMRQPCSTCKGLGSTLVKSSRVVDAMVAEIVGVCIKASTCPYIVNHPANCFGCCYSFVPPFIQSLDALKEHVFPYIEEKGLWTAYNSWFWQLHTAFCGSIEKRDIFPVQAFTEAPPLLHCLALLLAVHKEG
jgi:hypothetical protein